MYVATKKNVDFTSQLILTFLSHINVSKFTLSTEFDKTDMVNDSSTVENEANAPNMVAALSNVMIPMRSGCVSVFMFVLSFVGIKYICAVLSVKTATNMFDKPNLLDTLK